MPTAETPVSGAPVCFLRDVGAPLSESSCFGGCAGVWLRVRPAR